ncbi:aminodeoxychorismate lyase [Psychrosphaera algicola]|uniref:Aminodeoxychorismate lyase n=1 Tax=Psychrosphaera algicola TaxID=3023714 RepID=A0ABT5FJQ9_9GAMM|nr:aminodeoxychorismate lyase [Psychrosphaera sp. G1-22]MDC2891416.1 aminodeoxychorismate lyase [Psychrosphaera sp. G1-22]
MDLLGFFYVIFCFNSDGYKVDLSDDWFKQRSFLYGDGHFTTASVVNGSVTMLDQHIERLQQANQRLKFNALNWTQLIHNISELVQNTPCGVLKIQIDRGSAVRGYGNTTETKPTVFVWLTPMADFSAFQQPVDNLDLVETPLSHNRMLAGLKHINRLEQVMIAVELERTQCLDGLVVDIDGNLIETNKANVFWCEDGKWFTPDLELCGVAGTVRENLLAQRQGIKITKRLGQDVLANADALVLSNALIKLQPVLHLAGRRLDLEIAQAFIKKFTI